VQDQSDRLYKTPAPNGNLWHQLQPAAARPPLPRPTTTTCAPNSVAFYDDVHVTSSRKRPSASIDFRAACPRKLTLTCAARAYLPDDTFETGAKARQFRMPCGRDSTAWACPVATPVALSALNLHTSRSQRATLLYTDRSVAWTKLYTGFKSGAPN